jgi:hypothetical protein
MGLYDCAAAFAAPSNTSAAIKAAMIHLFFMFTPSLRDLLQADREASTSERAGLPLAMGCARQLNFPQ